MNSIHKTIAILTAAGFAMLATQTAPAQEAPTAAANALRIATGKKGKGYSKLLADIRAVCGMQVPMVEVETEGGLQNLTTLAANQADLGFVQADTLIDMKDSDEAIASLLAVMPLNVNLLHMVAKTSGFTVQGARRMGGILPGEIATLQINKFSDLKGMPVAVVGSARALGRALNRVNGMSMRFIDVETDEQALDKLNSGEIAAFLSTSGWPSGPIQKLKRDSGVRLLTFDMPVQPPYKLVRKNYENLDTFNLAFLASTNVLVTRPFSATGANGKAVANLQACIQKNLTNLQEGQFEPAWREAKANADMQGWPRFAGLTKRP